MQFKKLTLEDKDLFCKYIYPYQFLSCEYSFATLYIWKDACDIQYAIYKDALIIKKKDFKGNLCFMQPLGYTSENLKAILKELTEYKKENGMKYLFKDLNEKFLEEVKILLSKEKNICIEEDKDNFDYLYKTQDLIKLSGKKLHGKKNHYNSFIKTYEYKIEEIKDKKVIEEVIEAAEKWHAQNNENSKTLFYEMEAIKNMMPKLSMLNLEGVAVYVNGEVAAFSIGEKVNDKMAVIHIEKGDTDCSGIYSFINKAFIEKCFKDTEVVNREQDLGIEGLRKSKMSYYPFKLEKKFAVIF